MKLDPFFYIKQLIKVSLSRIPYGCEILLWLKKCYSYMNISLRYKQYKKLSSEKKEADLILNSLRIGKIKRALIVSDSLRASPTYGDYFFVVMLARYFTSHDIPVSFIIVDGEYKASWSCLDETEKSKLVENYVEMANLFLDSTLTEVKVLKWHDFKNSYLDNLDEDICFPFGESVAARTRSVYGRALNTLNFLCAESSQDFLDRFLLSYSELEEKVPFKKPVQPYITWACRYSMRWSAERNATEFEFLQIFSRLKTLYPNHAIMIVSDEDGCNYFKNITLRHNINCIFSKTYSQTLVGDAALILGSTYFYMLRGGGIAVFPMFSRIPHERLTSVSNEVAWINGRATSWATEDQIFKRLDHTDSFRLTHLPTLAISSHEVFDSD